MMQDWIEIPADQRMVEPFSGEQVATNVRVSKYPLSELASFYQGNIVVGGM